jgi:hypothetical protein
MWCSPTRSSHNSGSGNSERHFALKQLLSPLSATARKQHTSWGIKTSEDGGDTLLRNGGNRLHVSEHCILLQTTANRSANPPVLKAWFTDRYLSLSFFFCPFHLLSFLLSRQKKSNEYF